MTKEVLWVVEGTPIPFVQADVWAFEASQPYTGLRGNRMALVADWTMDAATASHQRANRRGRAGRPHQYCCRTANHSMMYKESRIPPRGESLRQQLAAAPIDVYQRHSKKKNRNYPRRKEEPSAGKPQIRMATRTHKQKLRELQTLAQVT